MMHDHNPLQDPRPTKRPRYATNGPHDPHTNQDDSIFAKLNKDCGCQSQCLSKLKSYLLEEGNKTLQRMQRFRAIYNQFSCGSTEEREDRIYLHLLASMTDDQIHYSIMGKNMCQSAFCILFCSDNMLTNKIFPALQLNTSPSRCFARSGEQVSSFMSQTYEAIVVDDTDESENSYVNRNAVNHSSETLAMDYDRAFLDENQTRGLCLMVTRTWGKRTLQTNSSQWRKLRQQVLTRDNYTCRFCGVRLEKFMVCDHINGKANDNRLENLGINCPMCDRIRHCGNAGIQGWIALYKSDLSQLEIVKKSQALFRANGRVPTVLEVDPNAIPAPISVINFANILMVRNYSDLTPDELNYRGFFTDAAIGDFRRCCK